MLVGEMAEPRHRDRHPEIPAQLEPPPNASPTGRGARQPHSRRLLGVRAVIAESFERIHRSNLIGMGVLPLQFAAGESVASLGLTGTETFTITGIADAEEVPRTLIVKADEQEFSVTVRIDTPKEQRYYRHGGILQFVLRQLLQ
jgi:aconitase A